jgi:hypothetical protein
MSEVPRHPGDAASERWSEKPIVCFKEMPGGVVIVRGAPIPLRGRFGPRVTRPDVEAIAQLLQVNLLED